MAAKKTATRRVAKSTDQAEAGATMYNDTVSHFEAAADQARSQFERLYTNFNEQAETFRGQANDMIETVRSNVETTQAHIKSVNAELVEHVRTEMAEAVDFANELARAKTVADAFEIQRSYWTRLFETRVERARGIANASAEVARETIEPFSKTLTTAFAPAGFERFFAVQK